MAANKITENEELYYMKTNCYSKQTVDIINSKKDHFSCNLIGSWTVQVGDMDQVVHLWKYTGGFEMIDQAKHDLWNDKVRRMKICTAPQVYDYISSVSDLYGFNEGAWKLSQV